MGKQLFYIIWGIVLVLAGGLFLASNLGWIAGFTFEAWEIILWLLSLTFFVLFALSGRRAWLYLFPACILAGIAITTAIGVAGIAGSINAAPILLGCALPFLGGYLVEKKANRWALIPFWALLVIALVLVIADEVPGEVVGTLVLLGIALPFLAVYIFDRKQKWALIPAFVLVAVGIIPLLAGADVQGEFIGAYVMFMIALPFFVVYFWSPRNWWALMPAGATASVGLLILFVGLNLPWLGDTGAVGIMLLGLAATFGGLWSRRSTLPTAWARVPAIILALAGLMMIFLGSGKGLLWPVLLIAAGLVILFWGFRSRGKKSSAEEISTADIQSSATPEALAGGDQEARGADKASPQP